jgi:DNA-directed RNA polymerase specialized sigma24 family protein
MSSMGSVTFWLNRLKASDQAAVQKLWEEYFRRLIWLARKRLQAAPRSAADEEDVALSAFDNFCRGVQEGRFPRLSDRDDLWQILVVITERKASNLVKHERRQKRGGGKVRHRSALRARDSDAGTSVFDQVISREPDPEFVTQVADECRHLLEKLPDAALRALAVWKMEGYTNDELATKLGRSRATVERKLGLIRGIWEKELPS